MKIAMRAKVTTMAVKTPIILIAAGGTGGHIFPALAIADELLRGGADVQWLGSGGMECEHVRERGLPLHIVSFKAPRGVVGMMRLVQAVWRAGGVLRRVRPAAVLGMGGYASLPGGLAAWLLRVPLLIHEQNAVAGRANALLSRLAGQLLTGFPDVFGRGFRIGNPVRREFLSVAEEAPSDVAVASQAPPRRLLILGGSQGARALNETVPAGLAQLAEQAKADVFSVLHQCGGGNAAAVESAYRNAGVGGATVREFIQDVAAAMRAADLIICRAGAATLAEIAVVGRAAVLVPYPYAAADHQTANARVFAACGAAVLCDEKQFTAAWLGNFLRGYNAAAAAKMAAASRSLAMPTAAADIAAACLREAGHAA